MGAKRFLDGRVLLYPGDCLEVLDCLDADSVDSVVTDPPYHLTSIVSRFGGKDAAAAKSGKTGAYRRASAGFMGRAWDGGDVAFRVDTWAKVLRVLKPGGYLLAFASTRGFWRMGVAIEDAGFIPHPMVAWLFGCGWPKATRINAEGYEGYRYGGQSLKPAIEPIFMGQKPFEKGLSGTANILKHGTGAVNIAGCRIHGDDAPARAYKTKRFAPGADVVKSGAWKQEVDYTGQTEPGRWPANVIHDGSDEVVASFPDNLSSGSGAVKRASSSDNSGNAGAAYGDESRPAGTPMLSYGDTGSASRFFYSAKADAYDRVGSTHPTVKPVDLMQYLVRLVTPPGGCVLDPFAGTGTTGEAAWREGSRAVLIEREPDYQADIARRMRLVTRPSERAAIAKAKGETKSTDDLPLFGGGGSR